MARTLEAWSPFRGVDRFRRDFDELVDRFLGGGIGSFVTHLSSPLLESFVDSDGKLVIRADLPGIDPKDVEITVTGDTLTLRGKREHTQDDKGRDFLYREVPYGSFERAIGLPKGVKPEDVKASYKNGVLELTIPVPKELAARKVPIQVEAGGQKEGDKRG